MIESIFLMGGLGLVVGICLAAASKIFYVYVDPKITAVDDLLPGANCGGCGLPGCSSNAEAIVAGKASPASCVAAGPETAEAIAGLLGMPSRPPSRTSHAPDAITASRRRRPNLNMTAWMIAGPQHSCTAA
jgi:RnfABCDGE-type electron transport complex B subunit